MRAGGVSRSGGLATAFATSGAPVDVSEAAPPEIGQFHIASTSSKAFWGYMRYVNALTHQLAGTDVERIQAAVDYASIRGLIVVIPWRDFTDRTVPWDIDEAILLPANSIIHLDDCYLKQTDTSRDNIFRSDNIGYGITSGFIINPNIHLIGTGRPTLEGADNPRATGDVAKTLTTSANPSSTESYGTDAGVGGQTQTGDWRAYTIYFGYVEKFSISGIYLKDIHSWGIVLERSAYGKLNGNEVFANGMCGSHGGIKNQDLLEIRIGCHNIEVDGVEGETRDDVVALNSSSTGGSPAGAYGEYLVTGGDWRSGTLDECHSISFRKIHAYGQSCLRIMDSKGASGHATSKPVWGITVDDIKDTTPTHVASGTILTFANSALIRLGLNNRSTNGNLRDITISNCVSYMYDAVQIDGGLTRAAIANIVQGDTTSGHSAVYQTAASLAAGFTAIASTDVKTSNLVPA